MRMLNPAPLLVEYEHLFTGKVLPGPVLDLACGDGRNGIFLARLGLPVICCDKSSERLESAKKSAVESGVHIDLWQVDLELPELNPLPGDTYGAVLVFRYLHRPLISCIRNAARPGALLLYETFTVEQPRFGKPHNPNFLLRSGELKEWFQDWEILHYFEGIKHNPMRAIAQIVCCKPQ